MPVLAGQSCLPRSTRDTPSAAVRAAVVSRFENCGQICTCNERMYLHERIADQFLDRFTTAVRELKVGGMTMILATHEMSFARDVADEVCFLEDGRIIESG